MVRNGVVRQGWQGEVGYGLARFGKVRLGRHGEVCCGKVR